MVQPHSIIDTPDEGTVLEPVAGGSGTLYLTLAAALAGEIALGETDRITGLVPQAGTVAGSLVGPNSLSAVNDFYKDYYVLNTDTTPSNGLVSQWARVSSYDGPTRTFTLDKPWDFSAESTFVLLKPAYLTLLKPGHAEDFTASSAVVLNLGGNRLEGKIDCTGEEFHWITDGYVTNGIQKSVFGLLKINNLIVSRRDATIYAILITNGNDLGRCELQNCESFGVVSARRGRMGWTIKFCHNVGVVDGSSTALALTNTPYRLMESVAGIAIAYTQLDVDVSGEFSGAVWYSENSITKPSTGFAGIHMVVTGANTPNLLTNGPVKVSILRVVGSGSAVVDMSGFVRIECSDIAANAFSATYNPATFSVIDADDLSGTATFTNGANFSVTATTDVLVAMVTVGGSADMSGAITFNGGGGRSFQGGNVICVLYRARVTGTISVSGASILDVVAPTRFQIFNFFGVDQNSGTPTTTVSSAIRCSQASILTTFIVTGTVAISVGTWTISSTLDIKGNVQDQDNLNSSIFFSFGANVSSGTWTISGGQTLDLHSGERAATPNILGGTGTCTVTMSSAIDLYISSARGFLLVSHGGASGSFISSGSCRICIPMCNQIGSSDTFRLTNASVAGSNAQCTGAITIENSSFGNIQLVRTGAGVGSTSGPSSVVMTHCYVRTTFETENGSGTVTWTGASIQFQHCHIEGLLTIVLTRFTTVQAFHSRFNGGSSNKSISASGTRPTTFRYWSCSFAQRYDDILPDVLNVYDVLPAQAALVQGQPVKVNAANQYQVCVAASIVDGVLLAAAGGAGTFAVCVRQGRVFVAVNAAVVNGDNLALDLVTPTQTNLAAFTPGQNVGTALENAGATVAGKSYAAVNER